MKLNYVALQELYDTLLYGPVLSSPYAESPIDRAFKECDDKICDKIIELKKKNADLEKERDAKSKENAALVSANADLSDRNAHLQRNYERIDRLWTSQVRENMELISKIADLQREKDELASQYQKLTIENKRLQGDEFSDLKKELDDAKSCENYFRQDRDDWRSRAMQAEKRVEDLVNVNDNLTKKVVALQKENEELEKSRKCYRQIHVGEGARHLWGMLQNVNNALQFELVTCFPDVTGMEDILNWNIDDFLDAYKKWQEEKEKKETDRMRDWLAGFCDGKYCGGCPLGSEEYKCGCGYSFKKADPSDRRIIPDEDIKRYYEKARGTICGIKPKEEEEHQLEYGDAVRVPWRDYDYMYIGPEGEHIRLFNPKTHSVVVVPATDNLPYQGCKIVLYNEDDIRKIWKARKNKEAL